MKTDTQQQHKKNVLFIGMTDYDFSKENPVLEKKFQGLSKGFNCFVLARGKGWRFKKYQIHFYLTPKIFGKLGIFFWLVISFFRGLFIIYNKKMDTIVAQSPVFEGFIATLLKMITGCGLVIETHGDWINSFFYYFSIPLEKYVKKIFITLGRFSLRRADKIRVISSYTRALVEKQIVRAPIYQFATFMDIEMFARETNISWEKTIVFTGVLYRLKGAQTLIKAFSNLRKDFPDYRLVIIGDGHYRHTLENLAREHKQYIDFVGKKELFEVKEIVKNCTVFVLPSLSEGLGRVLIEASVLGKPIIGSNIGGIPDLIEDGANGYLFEAGNADALEQKLRLILNDKEKAKKMGAVGKERALKTYSTSQYFDSYIKMINE